MQPTSDDFLSLQAALAGEYSLQRELGRGGMGIVYLARDVQLDRDVAIKVLPAHLAASPAARERFVREARLAAGLSHPHIVPIHRVGEADGFVFFVMSYIEGETLGDRLRARGPLPPAEATRLLREVAWALAYAHGRGIVHRDVKPDNILLEAGTGRAIVTDFGIAHADRDDVADDLLAADDGKVMGTAHFMSPEQAAQGAVDGRSDLYSLGVVGHLMLSGRLPFDVPHIHTLLLKQATEEAPGLARVAPGVPAAIAAAIDRCLARDPAARFANAEALAEALVPPADARPALPTTLRAWLGARNPLLAPYFAWSGLFGTLTTVNVAVLLAGKRGGNPWDILIIAAATVAPLFPIVGFHLNQARRQFRAGHSLADLRAALDVERKERAEAEASVRDPAPPAWHTRLRVATLAAAGTAATTMGLLMAGVIHENQMGRLGILATLAPFAATLGLGAIANALDVPFVPSTLKKRTQSGLRGWLWNSKLGEWFARRLGAPERTALAGRNAFRATEVALGVAAGELFAALPSAYREQLGELPAIVESLEARAAEARAELDVVAALAPADSPEAAVLEERKRAAAARLGEAVAALEGIRLDLLRLHAGAADLQPLTTLMDAARELGDEAARLADAQREVDAALDDRGGRRGGDAPAR